MGQLPVAEYTDMAPSVTPIFFVSIVMAVAPAGTVAVNHTSESVKFPQVGTGIPAPDVPLASTLLKVV